MSKAREALTEADWDRLFSAHATSETEAGRAPSWRSFKAGYDLALAISDPEAAPAAQAEPSQAAPVQGEGLRELVADLRLIAAWHTPAGPTPKMRRPNVMQTCLDAASKLASSEGQQPGDGA